jgi:hypothetical protein
MPTLEELPETPRNRRPNMLIAAIAQGIAATVVSAFTPIGGGG